MSPIGRLTLGFGGLAAITLVGTLGYRGGGLAVARRSVNGGHQVVIGDRERLEQVARRAEGTDA